MGAYGGTALPTYTGHLRIPSLQDGQTAGQTGGIEFLDTTFQNGFGWRLFSVDLGNGVHPFHIQSRTDTTAWTTRAFIYNSGETKFLGQVNGGYTGKSGTGSINWNQGNIQEVTLTGTTTFTFSNGVTGGRYTLKLKQDGSGNRTASWGTSVRWVGGTTATLSTAANRVDIFNMVYDGNAYYTAGVTGYLS
jgi:hypothetical protein